MLRASAPGRGGKTAPAARRDGPRRALRGSLRAAKAALEARRNGPRAVLRASVRGEAGRRRPRLGGMVHGGTPRVAPGREGGWARAHPGREAVPGHRVGLRPGPPPRHVFRTPPAGVRPGRPPRAFSADGRETLPLASTGETASWTTPRGTTARVAVLSPRPESRGRGRCRRRPLGLVRVLAWLGQDRLEHQHPLDEAQEHRHVAYEVVRVPAAGRALDAGLGPGAAPGPGGEQRAPLGELGCYLREHFPGTPDLGATSGRGLRTPPRGEHGGRGAQGGEMRRRIALVRGLQRRGLVEAGAGLGEQVEGGGRGRRPAQHGVYVARRAGQ